MVHFRDQRQRYSTAGVVVADGLIAVPSPRHLTLPDDTPMSCLPTPGRGRPSRTTLHSLPCLLSYLAATGLGKHRVSAPSFRVRVSANVARVNFLLVIFATFAFHGINGQLRESHLKLPPK